MDLSSDYGHSNFGSCPMVGFCFGGGGLYKCFHDALTYLIVCGVIGHGEVVFHVVLAVWFVVVMEFGKSSMRMSSSKAAGRGRKPTGGHLLFSGDVKGTPDSPPDRQSLRKLENTRSSRLNDRGSVFVFDGYSDTRCADRQLFQNNVTDRHAKGVGLHRGLFVFGSITWTVPAPAFFLARPAFFLACPDFQLRFPIPGGLR
jgi:hypothetical protein